MHCITRGNGYKLYEQFSHAPIYNRYSYKLHSFSLHQLLMTGTNCQLLPVIESPDVLTFNTGHFVALTLLLLFVIQLVGL